MGKRSRERKNLEKIKRLKRKLKDRARMDPASSRSNSPSPAPSRDESRDLSPIPMQGDDQDEEILSPMRADDVNVIDEVNETNRVNEVNEANNNETKEDLPAEILEILGLDPSKENKKGENIHKELLPRWKHILANGLDKDGTMRKEICSQYNVPENLETLKAPKLNPQVGKLLNPMNIKKELFNENKQNQLASCLAAVAKALNIILANKEAVPQGILKPLSDAGRILCDLHYRESLSRRYAIINVINKDMRDTLKKAKIDEFLFEKDLAEQLKIDREITRAAGDLRIPRAPFRPPAMPGPFRGTLNYRGMRGAATPPVPRQYPPQRQPAAGAGAPRGRDRDYRRYESESSRRINSRGRTSRR